MAYCLVDEIFDMLKVEMLSSIAQDEYEDPETMRESLQPIVEMAVTDAANEIDGYLMKRYKLPFITPPKILNKLSKDIAVYNVLSRRGIEKDSGEANYLTRYNAAIKFLSSVATGLIEIGSQDGASKTAAEMRIKSNKRNFSRDSMRGW